MAIQIDWRPASQQLHQLYGDLTGYHEDWPRPNLDESAPSNDAVDGAVEQWTQRLRATYVTMAEASALHADLVAVGAPLDVLTGASYAGDELNHHLAGLVHLIESFDVEPELTVPDETIAMATRPPSWEKIMARTLELFAFNLAISRPIYEALGVTASDAAIAERCQVLGASIGELIQFGQLALEWMGSTLPQQKMELMRARLPRLMTAYESLCGGSPQLLDELAGEEVAIESSADNLGVLDDRERSVIFYDTLMSSIFPTLDTLGIDGTGMWQRRPRELEEVQRPLAAVAGVGFRF